MLSTPKTTETRKENSSIAMKCGIAMFHRLIERLGD